MSCKWCDHARSTPGAGWGDPYVTHCGDKPELAAGHPVHPKGRVFKAGCHATWKRGTNITHCVRCHQTFATSAMADLHDDASEGRCRTGETVGLVGVENDHGTVIWRRVKTNAA